MGGMINDRLDFHSIINNFIISRVCKQQVKKGERMKYTKTMLVSIIALILWCGWNTIASNDAVQTSAHARTQQKILLREVSYLTDRLTALEQLEPEVIVKEVIKEIPVVKCGPHELGNPDLTGERDFQYQTEEIPAT